MARDSNWSTERNHERDRIKEDDVMKQKLWTPKHGVDQGISGGVLVVIECTGGSKDSK